MIRSSKTKAETFTAVFVVLGSLVVGPAAVAQEATSKPASTTEKLGGESQKISMPGILQTQSWQPVDLMPRAEDYTTMYWVDGFPDVVPTASWQRCIQTGYFALVMNTETLEIGDENGLTNEWDSQWGGDVYRTVPVEFSGRIPWASLHEAVRPEDKQAEAWANRGIIIRSWKARLGGQDAAPWIAERGVTQHRKDSSTLDIVPPPSVTRLDAGDFVEATIEHVVMPQFADEYYGPNEHFRAALRRDGNTWQMIYDEALSNDRELTMTVGELERRHPDIRIRTKHDQAQFTLAGGLGYVPITFTGLTSPRGYQLFVNDKPLDQNVRGNDFWQTDFDTETRRWSQTYNVPKTVQMPMSIHFRKPETSKERRNN